MNIFRNI